MLLPVPRIPVLGTRKNHPCSWYWQKSFLFLVLAKIIPVLGTGKNHPCSRYWLQLSLFLVLAKIIPVLGIGKSHPCMILPVPRTGMIFASTKNRDDFCQYQEQG
jgi:hypothetical protein